MKFITRIFDKLDNINNKVETIDKTLVGHSGELKGIKSHLERLNTYNNKCAKRHDEQDESFNQLKTDFKVHKETQEATTKTKSKFSTTLIAIIMATLSIISTTLLAIKTLAL